MVTRIFSLMLAGLFGLYIVNYAFYTHRHILVDGTVITHAHPYNKSDSKPFKSHQHSKTELVLLGVLKVLFFISGIYFAFIILRNFEILYAPAGSGFTQLFHCHRASRAPPA